MVTSTASGNTYFYHAYSSTSTTSLRHLIMSLRQLTSYLALSYTHDVICDVIGNTTLTHSYSYTVGLGLTRGALHESSCARAARSMTSLLHVTNDVITYF